MVALLSFTVCIADIMKKKSLVYESLICIEFGRNDSKMLPNPVKESKSNKGPKVNKNDSKLCFLKSLIEDIYLKRHRLMQIKNINIVVNIMNIL